MQSTIVFIRFPIVFIQFGNLFTQCYIYFTQWHPYQTNKVVYLRKNSTNPFKTTQIMKHYLLLAGLFACVLSASAQTVGTKPNVINQGINPMTQTDNRGKFINEQRVRDMQHDNLMASSQVNSVMATPLAPSVPNNLPIFIRLLCLMKQPPRVSGCPL